MGGPVIEQLQQDGLKVKPFMTTNASKSEAIEALALAFERGEIQIPNDPTLISELQAFESKPLPSGIIRYEAPTGSHDDTVLALAIAGQGVAGHARRKIATDFFQSVMAANVSLSGNRRRDARDEPTPSDFPEGGSRSFTSGNPFNPSRWND
jgi:hypothetical protein